MPTYHVTDLPAWISCLPRSYFFLKKRLWAPSHLPFLWCPPSSLLSLSQGSSPSLPRMAAAQEMSTKGKYPRF